MGNVGKDALAVCTIYITWEKEGLRDENYCDKMGE
jgi:hypothetical protein